MKKKSSKNVTVWAGCLARVLPFDRDVEGLFDLVLKNGASQVQDGKTGFRAKIYDLDPISVGRF